MLPTSVIAIVRRIQLNPVTQFSPVKLSGTSAAANFEDSNIISFFIPLEISMTLISFSTEFLKENKTTAPRSAIARTPAALATLLLIPEAIPELYSEIAPITAVVKGATVMPIPIPRSKNERKNVFQYAPGPGVIP